MAGFVTIDAWLDRHLPVPTRVISNEEYSHPAKLKATPIGGEIVATPS
jgi:hypothetical protein